MRLHLCGPMRGLPNFNFAAFSSAAAALRAKGHTVTVPTEHDQAVGFDPFKGVDPAPDVLQGMVAWNLAVIAGGQKTGEFYEKAVVDPDKYAAGKGGMRLAWMEERLPIDGVVLLPGWRQSEGAKLEALVASRCGRKLFLFDWETEGFLEELAMGAYGLHVAEGS